MIYDEPFAHRLIVYKDSITVNDLLNCDITETTRHEKLGLLYYALHYRAPLDIVKYLIEKSDININNEKVIIAALFYNIDIAKEIMAKKEFKFYQPVMSEFILDQIFLNTPSGKHSRLKNVRRLDIDTILFILNHNKFKLHPVSNNLLFGPYEKVYW